MNCPRRLTSSFNFSLKGESDKREVCVSHLAFEWLDQCCNEDQKWTEDEDEESSGSEKRPKTKTKILRNFEKSSKTFEDRNFFEDIRRTEDFQKNLKENAQFKTYVLCKRF